MSLSLESVAVIGWALTLPTLLSHRNWTRRCQLQTVWSVALAHSCYAQSREFHVALTTASLFAIVNEFAMSVGMSQSP